MRFMRSSLDVGGCNVIEHDPMFRRRLFAPAINARLRLPKFFTRHETLSQ